MSREEVCEGMRRTIQWSHLLLLFNCFSVTVPCKWWPQQAQRFYFCTGFLVKNKSHKYASLCNLWLQLKSQSSGSKSRVSRIF